MPPALSATRRRSEATAQNQRFDRFRWLQILTLFNPQSPAEPMHWTVPNRPSIERGLALLASGLLGTNPVVIYPLVGEFRCE